MIFYPLLKLWVLINKFKFTSLFVLILLEEAGVPLPAPGDIFIINVGRRSSDGLGDFFHAMWVVVLATLLGSSILYFMARKFGRAVVFKYLKFLHINKERLLQVEDWFQLRGGMVLVIGRITPGLRILTTLAAGFFKVPYPTFIFYTGIASFIWVAIYFFLGQIIGDYYLVVFKFLFRSHPYVTYPVVLVLAFLLLRFLYNKTFLRFTKK